MFCVEFKIVLCQFLYRCGHFNLYLIANQTISDSFLEMCSPVKFAHSLVCICKGKSICSKNYVCVEQNVSCTSICGCQGNEECRNKLSHQLSVAENLGNDEDCPSDI